MTTADCFQASVGDVCRTSHCDTELLPAYGSYSTLASCCKQVLLSDPLSLQMSFSLLQHTFLKTLPLHRKAAKKVT